MSRDAKLEVAAVNLRIPEGPARDYDRLLRALARTRRGVKVYGDTVVALQSFDSEEGLAIFSKFTEIDVDGEWFDVEEFSAASDDDKADIKIPPKLRPNYAAFYGKLDIKTHVLGFEVYSESKNLSPRAVEKYFKFILASEEIVKEFGRVEADLVKSYDTAASLLRMPHLREIRFLIRRPNHDDLDDDLARVIEERLNDQCADEYEEVIRVRGSGAVEPDSRSKRLAVVAAENGNLSIKSVVNGVTVSKGTAQSPLKEVAMYPSDEATKPMFLSLARRLFTKIAEARASIRDE